MELIRTHIARNEAPVEKVRLSYLQLLCLLFFFTLAAGLHKLLAGEFQIKDLIQELVIS